LNLNRAQQSKRFPASKLDQKGANTLQHALSQSLLHVLNVRFYFALDSAPHSSVKGLAPLV
jgi:hypothetical protein